MGQRFILLSYPHHIMAKSTLDVLEELKKGIQSEIDEVNKLIAKSPFRKPQLVYMAAREAHTRDLKKVNDLIDSCQ